ncbi:MAG: RagB/SusD family nutrient uptake outer membrane protein [Bacteroidales bacterium]|nr:RagB/SusD family nutrient uptake outer membrane protein [Bacteroidales bacterium]MDD4031398.1 RagB/SusD family nutrient uptake outer membrane protein [Bacteroidales bacterium]
MKKILKNSFLLALAFVFLLSSCINDLDTLPLNETDATSETAYAEPASYLNGLAYLYGYWALVSQNDMGSSDIAVSDAGQSELTRMYMVLNELSTDSFKIIWGDNYIAPIQYHRWTSADNEAIIAVYTRCMKGITLVNEYLIQTTDEKLNDRGHSSEIATIHQYRAEARFNRALYYYLLLDLFGNPPFALEENIGGELPKQIGRAALYTWLEDELLDLANSADMPAKGDVPYPRATKGSAWAVLARMYLNAEVYTGTAQWQKAKEAAATVIGMGYSLHPDYHELFMQDNTTNGANREFIVAVVYDKDNTQSWGGTTHLVSATLSSDANKAIAQNLGLSGLLNPETWNGYHVADDYVQRFELEGVQWGTTSGFGYDREKSDKRAFFYNIGSSKDFDNTTTDTGWRCWKFSGLYSDGHTVSDAESNYKFSSIDFPVFRLAEMYLIYAEADARLNGGVVTDPLAKGYINQLRVRAGVATKTPETMDLDWLLDERARELMWEGHRRTDLIRYGYFTSMQYPWTLKGGVMNGKVSLPEHRKVYPIILSDLNANPNLVQNTGY